MSEINLDEYTEFAKVKDIWNDTLRDKKGLNEFLNNIVMNNNYENGYGKMLPSLSDINVLVSNPDFPFDKLSAIQKNSIDLSAATQNFVLGYIWLCPWILESNEHIPYKFINFIDSRISGLNIAKYMIEKYEQDNYNYKEIEIRLFPFEIMFGAEKYWKKYFMDEYSIKSKTDLEYMITECCLKKEKDIRWCNLFSVFEM